MDSTGFLAFILLVTAVTFVSYGFDRLYAQVIPVRFLYYALRMPGVILHELSHIIGCLVVGAEIKKVVLFSKGGGSVTHIEPKLPVIGTVIISTAPLLLLPLVLSLLTWAFLSFFGCSLAINLPNSLTGSAAYEVITAIAGIFIDNLFVRFNGWFLLYLCLCTSIILSLAPSAQDFTNAAAGIIVLAGACLLIVWSGYAPAVTLLDLIIAPMAYAFTLGLIFEMIVAVVSLPLILIYGIRKER